MTKTIEERAETFAEDNWGRGYSKEVEVLRSKEGYIEGATEQRKIDIDKACEWFSEHIIDYACYNEMDGWDIHHKEMHEDFRKAMEE